MCVHIMAIMAMADNYEHDLPPNYIWLFKSLKCAECVVGSLVISFLSHLQATPPATSSSFFRRKWSKIWIEGVTGTWTVQERQEKRQTAQGNGMKQ